MSFDVKAAVMSTEKRSSLRRDLRCEAMIIDMEGQAIGTTCVENISATGAKLVVAKPAAVPDKFVLLLSKGGKVRRLCRVRWRTENAIGVHFDLAEVHKTGIAKFIEDALARITSETPGAK